MNTLAKIEAARDDALEQLTERSANRQIDKTTYRTLRQAIHAAFDEANRRLLGAPQTRETAPAATIAPEPDKAIPAPAPQPTTVVIGYNGVRQSRRIDENGQIMQEPFEISDGRARPTFGGDANEVLGRQESGGRRAKIRLRRIRSLP